MSYIPSLLLGATLLLGTTAHAAILVQDDFNYPVGPIAGQDGGYGWSGAWSASEDASVTVEPQAFTPPPGYGHSLPPTSLRIVPGSRTAEAKRKIISSFSLNPARETTLYFSLFFTRTDTEPGNYEQLSFLFLRDSYGRQVASFGANSLEGLTLSLAEDTTGSDASVATSRNNVYLPGLNFGQALKYWVLGKMVLRPAGMKDEFSLSIFPADSPIPLQEPAEWDLSLSAEAHGTVQNIFFTAGSGVGAVNIAGFYLGTAYSDVTGSSPTSEGPPPATAQRAAAAPTLITTPKATGSEPGPATPTIRNIWLEKHEGYNDIARRGGIDLLFLGDSITEGWRYRGEAPQVWRDYYGTRRAENFGIGGDRVEHLLWRVVNSDWRNISPKLVVILIGTNNVSRDAPSDIVQGILAVTNEVHRKLPESKILLMAVFPRDEQPDTAFRHRVEEINRELEAAELPPNVGYLDIGDKFLTPEGVLPKGLFYDGLHPTRKGHEIWAESIEPYVKRYVDEQ